MHGEIRVDGIETRTAVDREVAWLRLAASGVSIDRLTDDQARYLDSWGGAA